MFTRLSSRGIYKMGDRNEKKSLLRRFVARDFHLLGSAAGWNALLGRSCVLLMLQDVDQFSQWVADIEPAHSPRLRLRAVFDGDVRFLDSC